MSSPISGRLPLFFFTRKHLFPAKLPQLEISSKNKMIISQQYRNNVLDYRNNVLDMKHQGHMGMVKMKMRARQYSWGPNINQDIEIWFEKRLPGTTQYASKDIKSKLAKPSKAWHRVFD
ncbi:unnamed protein product [Gordionus sp. m RMFG-2023]